MAKRNPIRAQAAVIRAWLDGCNPTDVAVQRELRRGLGIIMSRQTPDEQAGQHTRWLNGRGFTGADAPYVGMILMWPTWRDKTALAARKILRKYAMQLAEEKLGIHR